MTHEQSSYEVIIEISLNVKQISRTTVSLLALYCKIVIIFFYKVIRKCFCNTVGRMRKSDFLETVNNPIKEDWNQRCQRKSPARKSNRS